MLKKLMIRKMTKLQSRKLKMRKPNIIRKRERKTSWIPVSMNMMVYIMLLMAQDISIVPPGKALLVGSITTQLPAKERAFSMMLMSNLMIQFTRNLVTSIILRAHIQ